MQTTTVRLAETTRATLRDIATRTGEPMSVVLDKAVEAYRRHLLLSHANAAYAALRAEPEAWKEEQAEREAWDATTADGLADDAEGE